MPAHAIVAVIETIEATPAGRQRLPAWCKTQPESRNELRTTVGACQASATAAIVPAVCVLLRTSRNPSSSLEKEAARVPIRQESNRRLVRTNGRARFRTDSPVNGA